MPYRRHVKPQTRMHAERMRRDLTGAEYVLWQRLRRRALNGIRFRQQEVILGFIVDFYCAASCLAIEVDGGYHNSAEQKARDKMRDAVMLAHGIRTIRFTNEQVLNGLESVLENISEICSTPVCLSGRPRKIKKHQTNLSTVV